MTDAERKLWWHLRGLRFKGMHFRRQATVGPYFVAFACHDRRIVIEVDGGGHAERKQVVADSSRTEFLNSRGYRVLRFWNNDVLKDIESVMSAIYENLNDQAPHPLPLPAARSARGGRGTRNAEQ